MLYQRHVFGGIMVLGAVAAPLLLGISASVATANPGQTAEIAPYFLTIQLDGQTDHTPDHVCIVSAGAHPEWRAKQKTGAVGPADASLPLTEIEAVVSSDTPVAQANEQPEAQASEPPAAQASVPPKTQSSKSQARQAGREPEASLGSSPAMSAKTPTDPQGRKSAFSKTWQFDMQSAEKISAPNGALQSRPYIAAALRALIANGEATATCMDPGEICRPSFEILPYIANDQHDKSLLHIACTSNIRSASYQDKQVLIMFLNTHTSIHPPIRKISLDGSIITVRLDGAITDSDVFVASVLGGHYVPGGTAISVSRRVILTPTPRCHEVNVELSDYDARSEQALKVELKENAAPLMACDIQMASGYAKVRLPERSNTDPKTLELRGQTSGLRFVATWSERRPPLALRGTLRGISLYWARHCLYKVGEACPAVQLLDSEIECDQGIQSVDGCLYRCDGDAANRPIHLPEVARFTRASTRETWTARVSHSGARVDAYIDARDRKVFIQTPPGDLTEKRAISSAVTEIELLFPAGRFMTLPFNWGMKAIIDAPDIQCHQKVIYRYIGAWPYNPSHVLVSNGIIALEDPAQLSLPVDLRIFVGIGYEMISRQNANFDGATVILGGALTLGRWDPGWFIDTLLEGSIGRREYDVQKPGDLPSTRGTNIARALLSVAPGVRVRRTSFSMGFGVGFSRGLDSPELIPGHMMYSSTVNVRRMISRNASLSLFAGGYLGEETRVLDAANRLIETRYRDSLIVGIRLEYAPIGYWLDRATRE